MLDSAADSSAAAALKLTALQANPQTGFLASK